MRWHIHEFSLMTELFSIWLREMGLFLSLSLSLSLFSLSLSLSLPSLSLSLILSLLIYSICKRYFLNSTKLYWINFWKIIKNEQFLSVTVDSSYGNPPP